MEQITNSEYKQWIKEIKSKIRSAQMKAALSINATLSLDLKDEFPQMNGFSVSNLKTCRLFYQYFTSRSQLVNQFFTNLLTQ